jgi:hypothetical protein
VLVSSPLHTGLAVQGKHHWYPDIDMMKQYEGKIVLYDEKVPEGGLSADVPESALPQQDCLDNWDKPIPEKFVR